MSFRVNVQPIPGYTNRFDINAIDDNTGQRVGHLDYTRLLPGLVSAGYLRVDSRYRGQGIAPELVRKLEETVGPNVIVRSMVLHVPTLEAIANSSYFRRTLQLQSTSPQNKEVIGTQEAGNLPLGRILRRAGLPPDRIEITPTHLVTPGMTFDEVSRHIADPADWSAYFDVRVIAVTGSGSVTP